MNERAIQGWLKWRNNLYQERVEGETVGVRKEGDWRGWWLLLSHSANEHPNLTQLQACVQAQVSCAETPRKIQWHVLVGGSGTVWIASKIALRPAVCVIAQYQMENNRPLYDVLIDDGIMMED